MNPEDQKPESEEQMPREGIISVVLQSSKDSELSVFLEAEVSESVHLVLSGREQVHA